MMSQYKKQGFAIAAWPAAIVCGVVAMAAGAAAQAPSQAEIAKLRSDCRSDFIAHCRGVTPGGKEALACLERNAAQLSPACRTAVSAVAGGAQSKPAAQKPAPSSPPASGSDSAATAPAAASADQAKAVQSACADDFAKSCKGVKPGGPEAIECLNKNAANLSDACWGAVSALGSPQGAPSGAAAAASGAPSPEQIKQVQTACAADFTKNCKGVTPGGEEALACLNKNAATLSDACWGAVSAIGQGGGAPPPAGGKSSAPAPSQAAAPPPQPLVLPQLRLRAAARIVEICRIDRENFCPDIPLGRGRVLRCLARNVGQVSPPCRAALQRAAAE